LGKIHKSISQARLPKGHGAIAGLTMQDKTIDEAKKHVFFIVTQEGNDLKLLNDKAMEYTD